VWPVSCVRVACVPAPLLPRRAWVGCEGRQHCATAALGHRSTRPLQLCSPRYSFAVFSRPSSTGGSVTPNMHIVHRARAVLSSPRDNRKQWLDTLFVVHAAVSLCSGVLAFAFPHLIAFLFGEEYHDRLRYNPDNETKVFCPATPQGGCGSKRRLTGHCCR
jgi:hypothetical protein